MYIKYNNVNYPCVCRPSADMVYRGLPNDFPAPVSGEIILCADDGFVMRTDNIADYLRQTFEDGVLTLTDIPAAVEKEEPDYEENPKPTLRERVSTLEESMASLEDALCEMDAANSEAIAAIEDALCELDT